jgi:hypothetical protein
MTLRVLSAVLLVLIFARSSDAACAWVLWSNLRTITQVSATKFAFNFDKDAYIPQDSFPTLEACNGEKRGRERIPSIVGLQVGDTYSAYVCLPDTIDPRGPKGTAR